MTSGTRHRFYLPDDLAGTGPIELPDRISRQVTRVLRLRPGDTLWLFNGDGQDIEARIIRAGPGGVTVETTGESMAGVMPGPPYVHLGLSLIKSDRFDLVVQKATELGVSSITAIESERCVVSLPADRARSRYERWRKVAIEALEQSERADLVTVDGPLRFSDALSEITAETRLIAAERTSRNPIAERVSSQVDSVFLLIGPEGGYTADEIADAECAGFSPVSLGPTILRSETAAIASVAMIRAITDASQPDRITEVRD